MSPKQNLTSLKKCGFNSENQVMEVLPIKRPQPSSNIKLGHSKEGSRFCTYSIERDSVRMIFLSILVSSGETLNLYMNFHTYYLPR